MPGIGSCLDISDLKRGQEKAVEGQEMESMGPLASGMARDFNNLLGRIRTSAELDMTESGGNGTMDGELQRIKAAALSGAQIAGEVMILGGRQDPAFGPV